MTEPAFLLDSNICIYLLGGRSVPARDRVQMRAPGEVVTSAIVFAEVMRGIDPDDRRAMAGAERLFAQIVPQPFDRPAALAYCTFAFKRARFDRLIAAHALSLGLTLVTNDTTDFADIAGLRVEDWTLPA